MIKFCGFELTQLQKLSLVVFKLQTTIKLFYYKLRPLANKQKSHVPYLVFHFMRYNHSYLSFFYFKL